MHVTKKLSTILTTDYVNIPSQLRKQLNKVQLPTFAFTRLLDKPYENEVTLTVQNPPLKCCQHIEIRYTVRKRVDLFMLKFWVCRSKGCKVTTCQSWSSQEKVCHFGHSTQSVCKRIRPRFEHTRGQIILEI